MIYSYIKCFFIDYVFSTNHYPEKAKYSISSTFLDLIDLSSKLLVVGGRLLFWFPVFDDELVVSLLSCIILSFFHVLELSKCLHINSGVLHIYSLHETLQWTTFDFFYFNLASGLTASLIEKVWINYWYFCQLQKSWYVTWGWLIRSIWCELLTSQW